MPTIDKRTSKGPRWRGRKQVNGVAVTKLFPDNSKKSYKAALAWEAEMEKQLKQEQEAMRTGMVSLTNFVWLNDYLDYCKDHFVEKTYKEKVSVAKRFMEAFGSNRRIAELDANFVLRFLSKEFKKRSGHAANRDRKNLCAGWNHGMKYLPEFPQDKPNPFQMVDKFPEERKKRYIPPESDFWKCMGVVEGQDRLMLLTLLHLGARKGEVFRLTWQDISFSEKSVTLYTRKRDGGNLEPDTLPMTDALKDELLWWWENRPLKTDNVFVNLDTFPGRDKYFGQPFKYRNGFMKSVCKRAEVKYFHYHAIRHLTASILYHEGTPANVVQTILRHKNATTTERYLHSLGTKEARKALNSVMDNRKPGKVIDIRTQKAG